MVIAIFALSITTSEYDESSYPSGELCSSEIGVGLLSESPLRRLDVVEVPQDGVQVRVFLLQLSRLFVEAFGGDGEEFGFAFRAW